MLCVNAFANGVRHSGRLYRCAHQQIVVGAGELKIRNVNRGLWIASQRLRSRVRNNPYNERPPLI